MVMHATQFDSKKLIRPTCRGHANACITTPAGGPIGDNAMKTLLEKSIIQAVRASTKDSRLRFVFATNEGYKISTVKPYQYAVWTNGSEVGGWEADDAIGTLAPNSDEIVRVSTRRYSND
jgi:hypothetical protein